MKCFFILIIILQFVTANIFLVKISNQTYETNDILQEEYSSALYEKHRYGSEDNDDEMGLLDYSGYFSETFRNRRKSFIDLFKLLSPSSRFLSSSFSSI